MNFIEQCVDELEQINLQLNIFMKSKVYRLTRVFKIIWLEIRSHNVKRGGKLMKNIFLRFMGKRDALSLYRDADVLHDISNKTLALQNKLQEKNVFLKHNLEQPEMCSYDDRNDMSVYNDRNILAFSGENKGDVIQPKGKRVAYFTNLLLDWNDQRPRFGGGERYCLTLSCLLKRLGFEVQIYQTAPTEFSGEYFGFPVQTIVAKEYFSEFNIDAANEFYEISKSYDYVIYNLPELSAMKMRSDALVLCHGIWFDHNNYGDFIKFRSNKWFHFLYNAFNNPRHIVSVDTNSVNVIRSLWPELVDKMTFIPNFVDKSMFFPPKERSNGKIKILFPRRSQINRGSRLLAGILERVPYDVDFYWVGEGDDYDTKLILQLASQDKRLHYEKAGFDEMPEWYRKVDITVIPTIACEGTSLSCIEALASGCATIATNVGGLTDIIYDEVNGLSVNPTAKDIADAINRLIEDDALLKHLQQRALEYSDYFSIENWEAKWIRVLRELGWIEGKKKDCVL